MIILGIETSCDETAASVVKAEKNNITVLSNIVSSQVKLHAKWGGVVPNLAAREHLKNILPVLEESLKEAGVSGKDINLIAVTKGPGLIPALLIGVDAAKALSYLWKKPLIGIHHIEGHIYANFVGESLKFKIQSSKLFPILCLVVSGGHTQLVLMKKHLDYKIIGETQDDAVGEAFDKVARILGLGYPGGPAIAKIARRGAWSVERKTKGVARYALCDLRLPRPMINSKDFNFSFSGLKTAVLYEVKKNTKLLKYKKYVSAVCAEFQQSAIDVLIHKTILAAKKYHPKTIMLAGGVSANQELRKQLGEAIERELENTLYIIPDTLYSIDNAAMIASAAYFRFKNNSKNKLNNNWKVLEADAGLKLN